MGLVGCADRALLAPDSRLTSAEENAPAFSRNPDLGVCQKLNVPAGSKIAFHAVGIGVQIYRWSGTSWVFVAPSANLYADAGGHGLVGTHFVGPTWLSNSGSKVVGTVATDGRCVVDPNSIPWLLLNAVASGQGVFERTIFIQRLNTVGGNAPSTPGSFVGQEVQVPYSADYYFYR
jgi:hypothetical protein